MGGGLRSNVLVPYEYERVKLFDYTGFRNKSQGVVGKQVICNFYKQSQLVFTTLSTRISFVLDSLADIGPLQIKCPAAHPMVTDHGRVLWDSISIERDIAPLSKPVSKLSSF